MVETCKKTGVKDIWSNHIEASVNLDYNAWWVWKTYGYSAVSSEIMKYGKEPLIICDFMKLSK